MKKETLPTIRLALHVFDGNRSSFYSKEGRK